VGIVVTALIFVLRYSFISAVHGEHELGEFRSSVERSSADISVLSHYSDEVLILPLRGFLFFGTSNTIREFLFEKINTGRHSTFLLDLRRVTGVDGSAIQVFRQIKQICDSTGIRLLYSSVPDATRDRLIKLDAIDRQDGEPLIFPDMDLAVEWLENELLARHADRSRADTIRTFLEDGVGDAAKAELLLSVMGEVRLRAGDTLFHQGDLEDGFYMLESGTVSALIQDGSGGFVRVKKFIPGALIGELSGYTDAAARTATVIADQPSVLYHLDISRILADPHVKADAMSAVHEMVARTLSRRLVAMNRRLITEIS
jgi:SulP family sulfate permease